MTCAPICWARSRRIGLKSLAITSDAPAARATPTAKQPIGPQPSTSTVLPGTSASSTVWTALPSGSMMAPTSVGMPSSRMTFEAGIAMNSANAPSRSTPMIWVRWHRCAAPRRHWRQWPQTMWPSAVTRSPTGKQPRGLGFAAELDDLAGELVADHDGRAGAGCWPSCPIPRCGGRCRRRLRGGRGSATSLGPQEGTGTSCRAMPGPGAGLTRARIEPRNEVGGILRAMGEGR